MKEEEDEEEDKCCEEGEEKEDEGGSTLVCASLCFRAKHVLISAYITLVRIHHSCPHKSLLSA